VWVAGVIPFFVGLALIINGAFVSKLFSGNKINESNKENDTTRLEGADENTYLPPADTNDLFPAGFSVTDETTQHLAEAIKTKQRSS